MGAEDYYFGPIGDLQLRPIRVKVRVAFGAAGAPTKSSTRRQSDPDSAVALGTTGQYLFTGLPKGQDYHITSCEIIAVAGTSLPTLANVTAFDASAGTMTVQVRQTSDGAASNPTSGSALHLSFDVETGAY
jgi:hypothetical protein